MIILLRRKTKRTKSFFLRSVNFALTKISQIEHQSRDYFAGIGKNLASSLNETDICFGREIINIFVMSPVTEEEVSASLRSLKNKASSGHDSISNKIVKISI